MSKENIICSKRCGICDGGKEVAKINNDYICDVCNEEYCSNAVKVENITKCLICKNGNVIKNKEGE